MESTNASGEVEQVIGTEQKETFRVSQEISLPGGMAGEEEITGEPIVIRFAGDFCLAEGFAITDALDRRGDIRKCFSEDLLGLMSDADLFVLNNEFTYSNRGTPTEGKDWTFRANPERVSVLNTLGVDMVGLANNHAYDWGEEALLDTVSTLQGAGIVTAGAGKNLEEARKPAYFTYHGRKIAVIAATAVEKMGDREYGMTKAATADSAGVFSTIDPANCVETIQEAKANSDFVFVYVHWGTEMTTEIDEDQKELAKAYIDAGADAVVGNHPHILQGFEYYQGKPILYSLGNFWFNSKDRETCMLEFVIQPETMETQMKFLPCLQSGCYTKLITDEGEKTRMIREMTEISFGDVFIDESGVVSETKPQ
ncbi:CapA family protein [Hominifimenecus sp. rT4P-3]|uniref:CapA family protein n=1 Tax=Hominifimenecus sp. rT4P-3 TaxID=3242979 RepID=UPI003DA2DB2E